METKVININTLPGRKMPNDDDNFVYIGRRGCGITDAPFGNYQYCQNDSRSVAVAKHKEWAIKEYHSNKEFRDSVNGLYGKTLVCFCKPKSCHGDILVELAESSKLSLFEDL